MTVLRSVLLTKVIEKDIPVKIFDKIRKKK